MNDIESEPEYVFERGQGRSIHRRLEADPLTAEQERRIAMTVGYEGGYFAACGDAIGGAVSLNSALLAGRIHRGFNPGTTIIGGKIYTIREAVALGFINEAAATVLNTRDDVPLERYVRPIAESKADPKPLSPQQSSEAVLAAFLQSETPFASLFQLQSQVTKP